MFTHLPITENQMMNADSTMPTKITANANTSNRISILDHGNVQLINVALESTRIGVRLELDMEGSSSVDSEASDATFLDRLVSYQFQEMRFKTLNDKHIYVLFLRSRQIMSQIPLQYDFLLSLFISPIKIYKKRIDSLDNVR